MLPETSGLISGEFASVLATSGTTSAEGERIDKSWKFANLVEALSTQWGDAALTARGAKARKSEGAVDNFDLSGLSVAAPRIENAISSNDTDQQINEYEGHDGEYNEEDDDWYTGDCDDELHETAYTIGTPTDDTLEQFDGNLEDADASVSRVYAPASRSFQEARELLSRVKSVRSYAQPSTNRKPAKSRPLRRKVESRQTLTRLLSCLVETTDLTFRVSSSHVQEASD